MRLDSLHFFLKIFLSVPKHCKKKFYYFANLEMSKEPIWAPAPDSQCIREMRQVVLHRQRYPNKTGCQNCGLLHPHFRKYLDLPKSYNLLELHQWPKCQWCQMKAKDGQEKCADLCFKSCKEYWLQQDKEFHAFFTSSQK